MIDRSTDTAPVVSAAPRVDASKGFGLRTLGLRSMAVAALCAIGFTAFSAAPAQAHHQHGETRCVAKAFTAFGREVSNTRAVGQRPRARAACRIALNKCENRLDRQRNRVGRAMPFAQCETVRQARVSAGQGAQRAQFRCVAEAYTRRGRALSRTRAVEVRGRANRACNVAINQCEQRLDRKRAREGRAFPRARCEVVRSVRISDANPGRSLGGRSFGAAALQSEAPTTRAGFALTFTLGD